MTEDTLEPDLAEAIAAIAKRWPEAASPSDESPVFILAAGWRSGSTLVQRMLMPCAFIWGEPYADGALIDSLSRPLRAINAFLPASSYFYAGQKLDYLVENFIANLYPEPEALLRAHLAFFERLFAEPARRAGMERWGLKEVRLGADHAAYLRWLFPRAKILFLLRNPWDAYRSYAARAQVGGQWYARWPDQPVTPRRFAAHWRHLALGFQAQAGALDALLLRYEDLAHGDFATLESYLGVKVSRRAWAIKPFDGPSPLRAIPETDLQAARTVLSTNAQAGWRGTAVSQGIVRFLRAREAVWLSHLRGRHGSRSVAPRARRRLKGR